MTEPKWKLLVSYYWLEYICLIIIGASIPAVFYGVDPRSRFIPSNSTDYSYPYENDTISTVLVGVLGLIPLVVAILCQPIYVWKWNSSWDWVVDIHMLVLTFLETAAVSQLITASIKVYVGRIRPSGLAMNALGKAEWNMSYVSGHSSLSFALLTFTALVAAGKTGIYSPRNFVLNGIPMLAAIFISCSRLVDYKHDFSDVNAGSALGFVTAFSIYFIHYPGLGDQQSHLSHFASSIQQSGVQHGIESTSEVELSHMP